MFTLSCSLVVCPLLTDSSDLPITTVFSETVSSSVLLSSLVASSVSSFSLWTCSVNLFSFGSSFCSSPNLSFKRSLFSSGLLIVSDTFFIVLSSSSFFGGCSFSSSLISCARFSAFLALPLTASFFNSISNSDSLSLVPLLIEFLSLSLSLAVLSFSPDLNTHHELLYISLQ